MAKYNIGDKIERLEIIDTKYKRVDNGKRRLYAVCKCECGTVKEIRLDCLGAVKSCGCLNLEPREYSRTHNETGSRLYQLWASMKDRCKNPNARGYRHYGGRGITYCDEWEDYIPFRDWALANGYEQGLSIDRIDNDGNYEPSNCRWVTQKEQTLNTRRNRHINYKGEIKTVREWADYFEVEYMYIYNRCYKRDCWNGDIIFEELFGEV